MPMDPERLERMKAAMQAVSEGMSIRAAAKKHNVNYEPLRLRVLEHVPLDAMPGGNLKFVSDAADRGLVDEIRRRTLNGPPVTRPELRQMVRRAAELTSTRPLPKEFPNSKWVQRWVTKHSVSFEAAEGYRVLAAQEEASSDDIHTPTIPQRRPGESRRNRSAEREQSLLVEWLTKSGNFELLSSPGGTFPMTKREGHKKLVEFMKRKNITWTMTQATSRYSSLLGAYRRAKKGNRALSPVLARLDRLFASRGPNSRDGIFTVCNEGPAAAPIVSTVAQAVRERISGTTAVLAPESVPTPVPTSNSATTQLTLESQRLTVQELQLQLEMAKLKAKEGDSQRRAEMIANLINAGKTTDEIREIVALL